MTKPRRLFRLTRFGRLIIVLMVTLTLLTAIPIAVGRARNEPDDLQALGFWACDGKPCFMGITPGTTTWDEANRITARHEDTLSQDEKLIVMRVSMQANASFDIAVRNNPGNNIVSEADLLLWSDQQPYFPKLGAFVRMYGPPRCVKVIMIDSMIDRIFVYQSNWSLWVNLDSDGRIGFDSPISGVTLGLSPMFDRSCQDTTIYRGIRTSRWAGFTSFNHYSP